MKNERFFNAYELLDIQPNATNEDVKKAYRKKSLEFHPDKHNNSHPATTMFDLITRAKNVLLDPHSRLQHDYETGIRQKPQPKPEVRVEKQIVRKVQKETDWGTVIGVGLLGILLGSYIENSKNS